MNLVQCNKCKWVHYTVKSIKMKVPYQAEPKELEVPAKCFRCGNTYKDFSPIETSSVPYGSTVQAIKSKDEV